MDYQQLDIFDMTRQTFQIDKPIRLIELFAGVGSQAMALRDLGADFEHYRVVEFDKFAVASYNTIHGTNFETTDIRNISGVDLGICDTGKFCYITTYSFPCFVGNTFVLTRDGLKQIDGIIPGDYVLTHSNEYKKVLKSGYTGTKNIFSVKGMCIDEIKCTNNHKFYARKMIGHYPRNKNGKRFRTREFLRPEWIECESLTKDYYLGVATNQNSVIPTWDGTDFKWSDGRKSRHKNQLSKLMGNHSFWWIIGRYLGDGWIRTQGGVIICCSKNETHEILPHLRNCVFSYSISAERTVNKIHIAIKELQCFCERFGRGAKGKRLPGFVFDMPCELLKSLIDGYVSSDGCYTQGLYKISSISKELVYGFAQLVAKAYKVPYRIYKTERPKKCKIEGRTVNQNDTYQLVWKLQKKKQDKAFYEKGYVWFPIKSVENTNSKEKVYDITVEDSHSFTANGAIVHNCQDLSVAGKQKGMTKGSGTRSGLLWEVERLLNECIELPQVLLMENVPAVHSQANIPDFQKWIDFLESKGYSNYWKDLNAKDYGVAQNRDRCFMVSFLGEWNYKFPQPIPLERKLKDYLEDEVDEKYYINNEKSQKLIQTLIENGTLQGCIGNINPSGNGMNGNVYAGDLSPTITTNKGDGAKIFVDLSLKNPNKKR